MTDHTKNGDGTADDDREPRWCPWCEAIITSEGRALTTEAEAYWHTYAHQDKAPRAGLILEEFEVVDTESADPYKPGGDA